MIRPFVFVRDHPYLVLNFQLERPHLPISITDLVSELGTRIDPAGLLLLRPLSRREARILAEYVGEAETEAWAKICAPRGEKGRRCNK
jgi:hypothetical protein